MMELTQQILQQTKKVALNTIYISVAHALHVPITGAIKISSVNMNISVTMMTLTEILDMDQLSVLYQTKFQQESRQGF